MPSNIINQFSADIEQLTKQMQQDAIDHNQIIWPVEEQQRRLNLRCHVLQAQLTLLNRVLESSANFDIAELNQSYQLALDEIAEGLRNNYYELLQSRLSPTHPVYLFDVNQNRFVKLDAAECQNRLTLFHGQLATEMQSCRAFAFGSQENLSQLNKDLLDELSVVDQQLAALKEEMNRLNEPAVERESYLRSQLGRLEKDRIHALKTAQQHEQFLTDCKDGEWAAIERYLQIFPDSAERQLVINQLGAGGRNGFHFACEQGQLPVVQLLLKMGADVHCLTDRGRLPVHLAVHTNNAQTEILLDLLEFKGANLHTPDPNQRTAFNEAAYCGNVTAARWLLNKGVALENQDIQGRTALHAAAAKGHTEMVTFLLDQGANSKITNQAGETSLIEAILNGKEAVAQLFFDRGLGISDAELQKHPGFQSEAAQKTFNSLKQPAVKSSPVIVTPKAESSTPWKWLASLWGSSSRASTQTAATTTVSINSEPNETAASSSTMATKNN